MKDYYLSEGEKSTNYDKDDKITFIKRNKQYGIVYSTNFYSPIFNNENEDDIKYQDNFGKNIFFYNIWKYSEDKIIDIDKFIEQVEDELCQIFRDNYDKDENKLSFNIKTLLNVIEEKKEITDKIF